MSSKQIPRTTLSVDKDTHLRFKREKPYESLSADEFLNHLLDRWEGKR